MGTVDEFNVDARKAVSRMGRWILLALYKHPPRIVEGHLVVRLEELRRMCEVAEGDKKRWLRSRITSWTWTLRWVERLKAVRWPTVKKLALDADELIRSTSDEKVLDRARQETYPGWKRVMAERKLSGRKRPLPSGPKRRKKKTA